MADTLSIISLVSFIIAGGCLVLAVFFWFRFRIPKVIGDLSGRTARKSIAKMRASNEESGNKSFRPSVTNINRRNLTYTMPDSDKLKSQETDPLSDESETGVLAENKASSRSVNQTVELDNNETELLVDGDATTLLQQMVIPVRKGGKKLTMLDEVIQIHTDEVIE